MKYRFTSPGDVYVCDLGEVCGSEQSGKRLVIVVSSASIAAHSPTVTIVPITAQEKPIFKTHYLLHSNSYPKFHQQINTVLCEQVRTIDKSRLGEKVCSLTGYDLYNIMLCLQYNFTMIS